MKLVKVPFFLGNPSDESEKRSVAPVFVNPYHVIAIIPAGDVTNVQLEGGTIAQSPLRFEDVVEAFGFDVEEDAEV